MRISLYERMPRSEGKATRWDEDQDDAKKQKEDEAKADSKDIETETDTGTELVNRVIQFFFEDDVFAHTFEVFANEHCHLFDLEGEEMKLEYTEVYNQFQALFESKIETFINEQGATVQDFYDAVSRAYARDRESSLVLCSEILVATADFDVFVLMMKQTHESQRLAKS